MRQALRRAISGVILASISCITSGYEVGTHARMTLATYQMTQIGEPLNLRVLGIEDSGAPFGISYYDVRGTDAALRSKTAYEQSDKRMPEGSEPLSINGWLMRGSIREDDIPKSENPQDDPYNENLYRVFHHFYDPIHDQGLFVPGIAALDSDIHKSPDWAIGAVDSFSDANTPEPNRRNHFTVFDAREAEWRALTGLDRDGNTVAPDEAERNKYWATLFRSLGDAAQPQLNVAHIDFEMKGVQQ